jgi:di/tricarboxylate transporter
MVDGSEGGRRAPMRDCGRGGSTWVASLVVSDVTTLGLIILGLVVLFVGNRLPVIVVALGAALSLAATGILPLEDALGGFGDPTVIFIASLFVVSEGLDASGVTAWAGQQLIERAGESRTRLLVLMMTLVALFTAVITVNGAVAALLPVVAVVAIRKAIPPSRLMMPLAFAAHAGALLALTGSPVNIVIANAAAEVGGDGFAFFEFALIGVPLLLGAMGIILVSGNRLLPRRTGARMPADLSEYAHTLVSHYTLHDPVTRWRVPPDSPLDGASLEDIDLSPYRGLCLLGMGTRSGHVPGDTALAPGEVVAVRGARDLASRFASEHGLVEEPGPVEGGMDASFINRRYGTVELLLPPRSGLVGQTAFPGMVTDSGDLVVIAIQRQGEDLGPEPVTLSAGDSLLVQGAWEALEEHLDDPDVRRVEPVDLVRRQAVPLGPGSTRALVILAGMIVLLATGVVSSATAGLLAAGAMILAGVVGVEQAYRGINWTTVILVAGMLPLSTAIRVTGADDLISGWLLDIVGDGSPHLLLAALFVVTATLSQFISNTATVLVVYPVAVAAALELGVSHEPVLMALNVAAVAAFLTPVATPVNLMVMEPGTYEFTDYWKFGLPLLLWFGTVSVLLVPLIWRF